MGFFHTASGVICHVLLFIRVCIFIIFKDCTRENDNSVCLRLPGSVKSGSVDSDWMESWPVFPFIAG